MNEGITDPPHLTPCYPPPPTIPLHPQANIVAHGLQTRRFMLLASNIFPVVRMVMWSFKVSGMGPVFRWRGLFPQIWPRPADDIHRG